MMLALANNATNDQTLEELGVAGVVDDETLANANNVRRPLHHTFCARSRMMRERRSHRDMRP